MLKNYLIFALRNFKRSSTYSFINLIGLSVGIAGFILMIVYANFQTSFDNFHKNAGQIYLALSTLTMSETDVIVDAWTSAKLADALESNIPQVEKATKVFIPWSGNAVISDSKNNFEEAGFFADNNFLNIFDFPLLVGDKRNILSEPNTILLTKNFAEKIFGKENPIGKILNYKWEFGELSAKIGGILEDIPRNSNLQFNYVISFPTLENKSSNVSDMLQSWGSLCLRTYVEFKPGTDIKKVRQTVQNELKNNLAIPFYKDEKIMFEAIKDIRLGFLTGFSDEAKERKNEMNNFILIAIVILLIAIINYINLSTARSLTRSKEIGIRKVVGAKRFQIIKQFLYESMITLLISTFVSALIIALILPLFNDFSGIDLDIKDFIKMPLPLTLPLLVILIALLSGFIPALVISKFQPYALTKNFSGDGKIKIYLRRFYVVIQYTCAIILITFTFTVIDQLDFIRNKNHGYNRERVVILPMSDNELIKKSNVLKSEMLKSPYVTSVSSSAFTPINIIGQQSNLEFVNDSGQKVIMNAYMDYIDENYINVFGIKLLTGRNITADDIPLNGERCLLNETFVKTLGLENPVGKIFDDGSSKLEIVGVVKDFNYTSLKEKIQPLILYALNPRRVNIAVKINNGNLNRALASIKEIYSAVYPGRPINYSFADDDYDAIYNQEIKSSQVFSYASFNAILLSGLGLFGLALFSTGRRTKEIGIRKVFGASKRSLIRSLSKEFIYCVIVANLIALPAAFIIMRSWLENFSYRIPIDVSTFFISSLIGFSVLTVSILGQILKAAGLNPIETLKYE